MQLSKGEVRKDQIQQTTDAAIGSIVAIGVDTARKVIHELGTFATEVYEIREAGRRAEADGTEVDVEQLDTDAS